ncbi:MAG: hypothetical protein AAFU85_26490 [Planctomycetota bacterium]
MNQRSRQHSTFIAAVILLVVSPSSQANPTNENPLKGMAVHGTVPGAKERVAALYGRFYEFEKACVTNQATMKRGGKVSHRVLSKNYSNIYLAKWYARELTLMGEPAGLDLERRYEMLRREYRDFLPAVAAMRAPEIQKLNKDIPRRNKTVERARELAGKGELARAEDELRRLYLKYLESMFYLDDLTAKKYGNPIGVPLTELQSRLNKQRQEKFRTDAEAKTAAHAEAFQRLQQEATRVVAELGAAQSAALADGQTGDAADAIAYLGSLWGNASAAVTRSVGTAWAYSRSDTEGVAIAFRDDVAKIEAVAVESINQVLLSLSSRSEDELRTIYPRVLEELSVLQRRYKGRLAEKFAPALEQLQMKHASFGQDVRRYTAATIEPTRWMNRFASRQAKLMDAEFPTAEVALSTEHECDLEARPEIYRMQTRKRIVTPGGQGDQLSWIAADSKALIGTKVREGATFRLRGTNVAVGRQTNRHYTNLVVDFPLDAAIGAMNEALLIDDTHGPLNFSSADALSSAKMGDFQGIGGKIKRLTPEASVTRIATLPDVAHPLIPLNGLPVINYQMQPIQQLMWRLDVEPIWVSHRLFNLRKPE